VEDTAFYNGNHDNVVCWLCRKPVEDTAFYKDLPRLCERLVVRKGRLAEERTWEVRSAAMIVGKGRKTSCEDGRGARCRFSWSESRLEVRLNGHLSEDGNCSFS
jgi:hypothetical protein